MSLIVGPDGTPIRSETQPEAPAVEFPSPDRAPADAWALPDARVAELLAHDHPLVRQYAVEQVAHRRWEDPSALLDRLDDEPEVALQAVRALEALEFEPAAEPLAARLPDARGELAAALASALGTLAPDRLMPAVRARGRLDDEAFAGTVTALAITGTDEALGYVDRALTRTNVVGPERRSATYSAALLSGDPRLVGRVLGQALAESTREAPPEGASYPARAAFAGLAGGPPEYAREDASTELWNLAAETLEAEAPPLLNSGSAAALLDALKARRADVVLEQLAPVAELEPTSRGEGDDDLGTMPRRRKGLLSELVRQRAAIGRLDPEAAALFVATAARATAILAFGHRGELGSPGAQAVLDALGEGFTADDLLVSEESKLVEALRSRSARDIRTLLVALVRSRFQRAGTIRRIARALFDAEHGPGLIGAAGESSDPRVHGAVVRAALARRPTAEAAVVEVLTARPLEAEAARFGLLLAEQLRTERVALAVGRSFHELREVDRTLLSQAVLRSGDLRLLPLVEGRAYADEPEEAAWVILSLVAGAKVEGALQTALQRVMGESGPSEPLQVPLHCGRCGETLVYGFEHAYIDAQASQTHGDPAFAGDLVCKACGARDELAPTDETTQILTAHLMQFLNDVQAGQPHRPLVTPARTTVEGREVGMAEAMRRLSQQIASSPDAIRPRLHRARMGLLLRRSTVREDIDRVFELDPRSVEARALEAQWMVRDGRAGEAMDRCAELVRELAGGSEPRIYDVGSPRELREGLEDLMLQLADDAPAPRDIDLGPAAERRRQREAIMQQQMQAGPPA